MRNMIAVWLVVLGVAGAAFAQSPLQRGIHVELAVTTGAGMLPDADSPDAWVVTITANGDLYFGEEPVTPESLLETMNNRGHNRERQLYIKADAGSPLDSLKDVLEVAHRARFWRVFLLTALPAPPPSLPIPPAGIPLWVKPESRSASVVVRIDPGQGSPTLTVNNQKVALKGLQHVLEQALQNQSDRVVLLRAGQVPFADLAHVVDVCDMSGAKPLLGEPEL